MRNTKLLLFIKSLLLLIAIILAGSLFFVPSEPQATEQSSVFVLDIRSGMRAQDIADQQGHMITRMTAAKQIMVKIVQKNPDHLFGLITYSDTIEYLVPPTLDSGTLLQYITSLVASSDGKLKMDDGKFKSPEWSSGLLASLQNKNILVVGDVDVPQTLHAKNIGLGTTIRSLDDIDIFAKNILIFQRFNISTVQTKWLIIILCLLALLSL